MDDKERIYDEQISPLVQQLIRVCQENGIPMFASFQYSDEGFCTSALSSGHIVIDHYRALAQCAEKGGVNIDKYMFWVAKKVREEGRGHSSIFLSQAGIPAEPETTGA